MRPRRGYPPGATALRPRRGIQPRRGPARRKPAAAVSRRSARTALYAAQPYEPHYVRPCHRIWCLRARWALPSDLSRILLPPAPILVVTRNYAVSLGRSGIHGLECDTRTADSGGLPAAPGVATTNPAIHWPPDGLLTYVCPATVPPSPEDRFGRPSMRGPSAARPRGTGAPAFRSRLRGAAAVSAKLRAVPDRWRSDCAAVTERGAMAVLVSIRQRAAGPQCPAEHGIRRLFELLPRGVAGRRHSTSRAIPPSLADT